MTWWRYQPVFVETERGERLYSLCEVYLYADGRLQGWSSAEKSPCGINSQQELVDCVGAMLRDACLWEPVAYRDLKRGLAFKRRSIDLDAEVRAAVPHAPSKYENS